MTGDDAAVRERVARLEHALAEVERRAGPALREVTDEAVATLLALYGEGIARILAHAEHAQGDALRRALAEDEWVAQLLRLHGLHPDPAADEPVASGAPIAGRPG